MSSQRIDDIKSRLAAAPWARIVQQQDDIAYLLARLEETEREIEFRTQCDMKILARLERAESIMHQLRNDERLSDHADQCIDAYFAEENADHE